MHKLTPAAARIITGIAQSLSHPFFKDKEKLSEIISLMQYLEENGNHTKDLDSMILSIKLQVLSDDTTAASKTTLPKATRDALLGCMDDRKQSALATLNAISTLDDLTKQWDELEGENKIFEQA